jgi:hypothetical protein
MRPNTSNPPLTPLSAYALAPARPQDEPAGPAPATPMRPEMSSSPRPRPRTMKRSCPWGGASGRLRHTPGTSPRPRRHYEALWPLMIQSERPTWHNVARRSQAPSWLCQPSAAKVSPLSRGITPPSSVHRRRERLSPPDLSARRPRGGQRVAATPPFRHDPVINHPSPLPRAPWEALMPSRFLCPPPEYSRGGLHLLGVHV